MNSRQFIRSLLAHAYTSLCLLLLALAFLYLLWSDPRWINYGLVGMALALPWLAFSILRVLRRKSTEM